MQIEAAYQQCEILARAHYENFPVGRFVPRQLRPQVAAVYAFARTADDIADEGWEDRSYTDEERLAELEEFQARFLASLDTHQTDERWAWIFVAVRDTIDKTGTPRQLYLDLLSAFAQDCRQRSYQTHTELLDYCRRSANPIGRLVLHLHGKATEENLQRSDQICTGLQLTNFWQDIAVDIQKDQRVYLPAEDREHFGVTPEMLLARKASQALRQCVEFQVARTWQYFARGRSLSRSLPFPLSLEIKLTWLGGQRILEKIQQQGYDTLVQRPKLGKGDLPALLWQVFSRSASAKSGNSCQ